MKKDTLRSNNKRVLSSRRAKPLIALTAGLLLLALAGCQVKSPVNPNAKNGNGSLAVNVQGTVSPALASPSAGAEPQTADNSADVTPTPAQNVENSLGVIDIREKMFVSQINDIYYNAQDYLGKTFSYEGIFMAYTSTGTEITYRSVIRYGPGCCGTDANCGFEVIWDGGYPEQGDWVSITGVLEEYEENGWSYLQLRLSSLDVLNVRGAEYVSQ